MKTVNLNDKLTIDFKSNYLPSNTDIKEIKSTIYQIDINNAKEDYVGSANLIYGELYNLSNISLSKTSLSEVGAQACKWIKLAEINPYIIEAFTNIESEINNKYLNIGSSNILSLFNLRRDMSSLDATQWGKGAEFATKYGILPKAGVNTTNIINESYKKLCENMNRAQSLQLRLNVIELEGTWDASSFSLGFEDLIKKQTEEGKLNYGFVKGLATSYNNKGDYKIYEVLDEGKKILGYPDDDEVKGIVQFQPQNIIDFIKTIFPSTLSLIYIISLYEKTMKYDLTSNFVENLAVIQNINDPIETDFRGTPIDNKPIRTSEGILI